MSGAEGRGLAFAVSVSSFTQDGFVAIASIDGRRVDLSFDEKGEGVFLPRVLAERIGARPGDEIAVLVEGEHEAVSRTRFGGVSKSARVSDPKVYYAVGREGGAVVRIARG